MTYLFSNKIQLFLPFYLNIYWQKCKVCFPHFSLSPRHLTFYFHKKCKYNSFKSALRHLTFWMKKSRNAKIPYLFRVFAMVDHVGCSSQSGIAAVVAGCLYALWPEPRYADYRCINCWLHARYLYGGRYGKEDVEFRGLMLTHTCQKILLESVVWIYDTFENKLEVTYTIT